VLGQWIRFHGTAVVTVSESAALEGKFRKTDSSNQTANMLLYVSDS
jgi:hypothetical protein